MCGIQMYVKEAQLECMYGLVKFRMILPTCLIGLQRYDWFAIRYVSRYTAHDTIRIAIHVKLGKSREYLNIDRHLYIKQWKI